MADQRQSLPRRHSKRDALQDLAAFLIRKAHVIENDLAALHMKVAGIGGVLHFGWLAQKAEHLAHVHQRLPDFAVDRAKKAKRQGDLDHVGVDHDEIAHRQRARLHAPRGHHHHRHKARRDQQALARIQEGQALPGLDRRHLIALHRAVIACGLACFGIEILDGFIVQQAVDGFWLASVSWSFISRRIFTRHSVTLKVKVT